MAWQLIYTSAPRSLEAGRSGFGTVARHRAISPLLVSAIERTSQFSRLPGVDAGRVIFSYRIVAVAGGRFHVLSSIRDAGADYTGRTNHLAHHLVADAREIAQLGAAGPSPADVLLAINWMGSWSEPPRYLEAPDEIALATIRPQPNDGAWQRVTGKPDQAWLLASGDAARGAYLIQPAGTDLRELYAESLRLIPERLWQIPLTTSLQPSDEPADFRWIGIEERSPLRAQTESTGRPVLNLAAPETLPPVDPALSAASRQVQPGSLPVPSSVLAEGRTASFDAASGPRPGNPAVAFRMRIRVPEKPCSTEQKHPHRGARSWWWGGAIAAAVVAAAAGFAGHPIYARYMHRKALQAEIGSLLGRSGGFFSDGTIASLKNAEPIDTALELAEAAVRSWQMADHADFTAMQHLPDETVRDHVRQAGLNIPAEINALDDRLETLAKLHRQMVEFSHPPEDYGALERLEKLRSDAEAQTAAGADRSTFRLIHSAFERLAAEMRAQTVQSWVTGSSEGRVQPAEPSAWFEKVLAGPGFHPEDEEPKEILKTVGQILDDWNFIDGRDPGPAPAEVENRLARQTVWPQWLQAKARNKINAGRGGKPAPAGTSGAAPEVHQPPPVPPNEAAPLPRVPLYFVNGKESLPNFRIEELALHLAFFLKSTINNPAMPLQDLNKDGNLRRSAAGEPDFKVNESEKTILPLRGAATLLQPFHLTAKDAAGTEIFQLWIARASGEPVFGRRSTGLSRKGDVLELNLPALGLTGTPKNPLLLELPESSSPAKPPPRPQLSEKGTLDLSATRKQFEDQLAVWKQQLAELKKEAAGPPKDKHAAFNEMATALEKQAGFSKDERKHLAANGASLRERCGGYIMAVSEAPKIEGFDKLFTEGGRLKNAGAKPDAALEAEVLRSAANALQIARGGLKTQEDRQQEEGRLDLLRKMLLLLQPETPQSAVVRQKEEEARKKMITDLESKLAAAHPLSSQEIPPGIYRLFARDGGADIPLVEIDIAQPSRP